MAQRSDPSRKGLNAEVEALRERVAELEAEVGEREDRMEAFFSRAFESRAALMAFATMEEGRYLEVNDLALETLGFQREEMIGKTPEELRLLVEPTQRDVIGAAMAANGHVRNFPITFRTKSGELRHGLLSLDVVQRRSQPCWFAVSIDVTAQRNAEEALREAEERWRSILKNAPGVIVTADSGGTVTFVNRTFSGIPPEQVLGSSVFDHVPAEDRQTMRNALDRALTRGETVTYELLGNRNGVLIPVESRVGPLEREGRTVGVTIVSSDISERKRAEEERRRLEASVQNAQRLESLGILAGGIAHDFNNLLVAILGNADLALMDIAPHAPYRGWVEQIKLAARRASELTSQMLVYAGQGTYVTDPLDLNRLVAEMGDLLRVSISKKVVLRHECSAEVPLVIADASQMRQVVMNLIINASEAIGDETGTVKIRISEVDLDGETPALGYIGADLPAGHYVTLEVEDTGCGMDAATQSKLFDPFFTTKFAGRGLGLAAVLGIVRAHRGAIGVRSRLNRGSSFRILLPVAEESGAVRREDRSAEVQYQPRGGTILVAEDDEDVRDVARDMLERAGFAVISAADGGEAVRVFRAASGEIDAVLLDLTMPKMDGAEVLRQIRQLRSDVKVVLCSGYTERRARELCDDIEQVSFVQKPFDSETLIGALDALLTPNGPSNGAEGEA